MPGFGYSYGQAARHAAANRDAGGPVVLTLNGPTLPAGLNLARFTTAVALNATGTMTTAAFDMARFDHAPVSLADRGVLLENAATNLVPDSTDLTTWATGGGASVSAGSGLIGLPSTILDFGAVSGGVNRISTSIAFPAGTATLILSAFIKSVDADAFNLRFFDTHGDTWSDFYPLTQGASSGTYGYQDFGGGIQRVWFAITPNASSVGANLRIGAPIQATSAGTQIEIAGLQVEFGDTATSYFATTGTSDTRGADILTLHNWTGTYDVTLDYDDGSQTLLNNQALAPGYVVAPAQPHLKTITLTPA